jgi:hypothetical protein
MPSSSLPAAEPSTTGRSSSSGGRCVTSPRDPVIRSKRVAEVERRRRQAGVAHPLIAPPAMHWNGAMWEPLWSVWGATISIASVGAGRTARRRSTAYYRPAAPLATEPIRGQRAATKMITTVCSIGTNRSQSCPGAAPPGSVRRRPPLERATAAAAVVRPVAPPAEQYLYQASRRSTTAPAVARMGVERRNVCLGGTTHRRTFGHAEDAARNHDTSTPRPGAACHRLRGELFPHTRPRARAPRPPG